MVWCRVVCSGGEEWPACQCVCAQEARGGSVAFVGCVCPVCPVRVCLCVCVCVCHIVCCGGRALPPITIKGRYSDGRAEDTPGPGAYDVPVESGPGVSAQAAGSGCVPGWLAAPPSVGCFQMGRFAGDISLCCVRFRSPASILLLSR